MAERILVPVDGSRQSFEAVELAARLARDADTEIELLHVIPDKHLPEGLEQWAKAEHVQHATSVLYEKSIADGVLQSAHSRLGSGRHVRHRIEHGDPAAKIIDVAGEDRVSSIVMGTQGLSRLRGMVMGSTAQKVALGAKCPVISVKT